MTMTDQPVKVEPWLWCIEKCEPFDLYIVTLGEKAWPGAVTRAVALEWADMLNARESRLEARVRELEDEDTTREQIADAAYIKGYGDGKRAALSQAEETGK